MRALPSFFFFNDTATTEIYTLSLHDALPILARALAAGNTASRLPRLLTTTPSVAISLQLCSVISPRNKGVTEQSCKLMATLGVVRSEEHTSELQSLRHLVCRLLLEKKKNIQTVWRLSKANLPTQFMKMQLTHCTQA